MQTLRALSEKLLQAAADELLDASLELLSQRISDEDVRYIVATAWETGEAISLRELLSDGKLESFVESTCTTKEQDALLLQLRSWLGEGRRSPDDPERLVTIRPLPREVSAIKAWAEEFDVAGELGRPAAEVLRPSLACAPGSTLLDELLASSSPARKTSMLSGSKVSDEARAYLLDEAAAQAAFGARAALWRTPLPEPPLRLLTERLRSFVTGVDLLALHAVRFVPARPVEVSLESGVALAMLVAAPEQGPTAVRMFLSGFEQRPLTGECDQCRQELCIHVRVLGARLFDACLARDDRLHSVLLQLAGTPSWKRFLAEISPEDESAKRTRDHLAFVLRIEDERASIAVRLARSHETRGKLGNASKLIRSSACADRDRPALEAMIQAQRSLSAPFVPADMTLWRTLAEHPFVELEASKECVRIVEQSVEVRLVEQPEGLLPLVLLAGQPVAHGARPSNVSYLLAHAAQEHVLAVSALTPALRRLLAALANFRGVLPPESYPMLAPWLASLRKVARVASPAALQGTERPVLEKLLLRVSPSYDEGVDIALSMRALPLGPLWPPGQGPELSHGLVDGEPAFARRDLARERQLAQRVLEALGVRDLLRGDAFSYRADSNDRALEILSRAAQLADVLDIEWAEHAPRLNIAASIKSADLKVDMFKKGEWFSIDGWAHTPAGDIAVGRLLEAARRGERFVRIEGQSYVEIEQDLFARLRAAQLCVMDLSHTPSLPAAAVPFWLQQLSESDASDADSRAWLARLRERNAVVEFADEKLRARLREYQWTGVSFMLERSRWARGVCLADEMGLGKTIQAICVLVARAALGPAVVVAPTSLVSNWQSELEKFAPNLRCLIYRGAKRKKQLAELAADSVLITSYDLLLRDREQFESHTLATLVVDEAQMIKNARSLRARAVLGLSASFRIALSGTPIENRLGDLWSLSQLVAPQLLGSWNRFRARFAVPIERYEDGERAAALRALMAPFILRRTKREVLSELPQRTEVIHRIELSPAEHTLYRAAVRDARRALGKRKRHEATRTLQILAELTRLRLLACHPRLVIDDQRATSSKLKAFIALVSDLVPRGHRMLVFSQFTRHLALVREALDGLPIPYLYLDGATPGAQRSALVAQFQESQIPLFLISLKAGGTGLNLTAADYVIHLDPWWNPSAEDQASDRAHRIGQTKPVTIVKLVSQDTIEEKVLALHGHKRRLSSSVLDGDPVLEIDASMFEELLEASKP
jgi:superfamily II DNA or RNA helicase